MEHIHVDEQWHHRLTHKLDHATLQDILDMWGELDAPIDVSISWKHLGSFGRWHTPLIVGAARADRLDVVYHIVKAGGDVDVQDHIKHTALYEATSAGHLDVFHYLVAVGARVDLRPYESSVLACAAGRGDLTMLQALLKAGGITPGDVNEALDRAARYGHAEAARLMRAVGGHCDDLTDLHLCALLGDTEGLRRALEAGLPLQALTKYQHDTPLHLAARAAQGAAVRMLLEAGADAHALNKSRDTPLHDAAKSGQIDAVQALLAAGVPIEARAPLGCTPLFSAIDAGQPATVEALLDAGADPWAENPAGLSAYDMVQFTAGYRTEIYEVLKQRGITMHTNRASEPEGCECGMNLRWRPMRERRPKPEMEG